MREELKKFRNGCSEGVDHTKPATYPTPSTTCNSPHWIWISPALPCPDPTTSARNSLPAPSPSTTDPVPSLPHSAHQPATATDPFRSLPSAQRILYWTSFATSIYYPPSACWMPKHVMLR